MLETLAPPEGALPRAGLQRIQPTRRPYPLLAFLRDSPLLRSDIAPDKPGIPLGLTVRLRDARDRPIERAAVHLWHHDTPGLATTLRRNGLEPVARMRGVQISDAQGSVTFKTIYPGRYRDGRVVVYLQVYFNHDQQVTARADICLLLPNELGGELRGIPLALPLAANSPQPLLNAVGGTVPLTLERLVLDGDSGGVRGEISIGIDL